MTGPPRIHRWPDAQWAAAYEGQVAAENWDIVHLDTSLRWDKRGFLAAARQAFGFPEWFGMNWDALADSLTDVPPPAAGLLVEWTGWGPMARMFPQDFAVAVDILAQFANDQTDHAVLVALVGSGPAVGPQL